MPIEFDAGPPPALAAIFETLPDHAPFASRFRLGWGPKFYRGRTDGSARVLVVGQDAASEEDIARRNFVGDAGRRAQGFLAKAGLTRSYVMINTFAFSVRGQFDDELRQISASPAMVAYRSAVFDFLDPGPFECIVAFGNAAHHAVSLWPGATASFVAKPQHPSARDTAALLGSWRFWLPKVRQHVTPDPDGDQSAPNYGTAFRADERPPIPRRDLPFGMPRWFGDKLLKTTTRRTLDTIEWKAPAGAVG
jgi:hypothetical protein